MEPIPPASACSEDRRSYRLRHRASPASGVDCGEKTQADAPNVRFGRCPAVQRRYPEKQASAHSSRSGAEGWAPDLRSEVRRREPPSMAAAVDPFRKLENNFREVHFPMIIFPIDRTVSREMKAPRELGQTVAVCVCDRESASRRRARTPGSIRGFFRGCGGRAANPNKMTRNPLIFPKTPKKSLGKLDKAIAKLAENLAIPKESLAKTRTAGPPGGAWTRRPRSTDAGR